MKSKKNKQLDTIIYRISIFVRKLFGRKHEIDSRIYRKAIYLFLCYKLNSEQLCYYITSIRAFKHRNIVEVEITTYRPGLIIGKAGSIIDALKAHITMDTKQQIFISLIECKLWINLYE